MVSFRSAKSQAKHEVKKHLAIGKPRQKKSDRKVHSLGTARSYVDALIPAAFFMKKNRLGNRGKGLADLTPSIALSYLEMRSQEIGQSQLDKDRKALQVVLGQNLPTIQSELDHAAVSRAYTSEQIAMIALAQRENHSFATRVAENAGLRAHELLTLRPIEMRAASDGRAWSGKLFEGRIAVKIYTVKGKGGLVRAVALSHILAIELEERRLDPPVRVIDRGIYYQQYYRIGGGKKWSDSFSKAAQRALGWSTGAHGTRHKFAQERMHTLQMLGYTYKEALKMVSQEMGHFRPLITEVYLR